MDMDDLLIYKISLPVFGIAAVLLALWIYKITPDNVAIREKIARNVRIGMVIAVIDLIWCIPHSRPLLPAGLQPYLWPAVAVCAIIAYNYLDNHFSRAIGGFAILLAYYFLHESFTFHTPAAPLFAIFCFAMGTIGIFYSGKPHLLRDHIRKIARHLWLKHIVALLVMLYGLLSLTLGIMHLTGTGIK